MGDKLSEYLSDEDLHKAWEAARQRLEDAFVTKNRLDREMGIAKTEVYNARKAEEVAWAAIVARRDERVGKMQ